MFDRRLITNFNWPLLIVVMVLSAIGLVNLFSATSSFGTDAQENYFKAQLMWTGVGILTLLVTTSIHYRFFYSSSYVLYGISIILLILVLVIGHRVSGSQSWIQILPGMRLQPSEIAKLGFILGFSRYLSSLDARRPLGFVGLLPSMVFVLVPFLLILKQGDLGSSLFFGLIYITMILVHGVKMRVVATFGILGVVLVVVAYMFFLSPYQKDRVKNFLNPELDRKGSGYHVVQAKIAVGSGEFWGKGFLKGQNHKLKFIPERHTDFIFPVLAEEWGFFGSFVVLMLFLLFLFLGLSVASHSPEKYGFFVALGICALYFWHMAINLGGVLGLMPLTGVPLPFLSYGGSNLLTNWLGFGLLLNISMRRFMFS
ncbi:rod shape-determining protein RodA [bacterium]|nr:rod shape-determining protein RodA [bacterium]